MNTSKSMLTDDIQSGLPGLSHNGGSIQAGLNAVFPDGHVKWQSVRGNPAIYDLSLWQIIGDGTSTHGLDVRYLLSALQN